MLKDTANRISYWRFIFLFLLFPVVKMLVFFANIIGNINLESWISYSYLLVLGCLIIFSKVRNGFVYLTIFAYCLLYVLMFDTVPINARIAYVVRFCFAAYAFWYFRNVRFSSFLDGRLDKFVVWFSFVFVLTYILSVYLHPDGLRVGGMGTRLYYEGFMIAHEFSYYCAILSLYLLFRKPFLYAIPVILAGVFVGARSGAILVALSLGYYAYYRFFKSYRLFVRMPIFLLFSFFTLLLVYFFRSEVSNITESLYSEVLIGDRISNNDFASGRTIILYYFINEVINAGLGFSNIFGRGPNSSVVFNEQNIGNAIWMHNDFIEVFFSFGALGLVLFLYIIAQLILRQRNGYLLFFLLIAGITNGFIYYNVIQVLLIVTFMNERKFFSKNGQS